MKSGHLFAFLSATIIVLSVLSISVACASEAKDRHECSYYPAGGRDLATEDECLTYSANNADSDAVVSEKVTATAAYDKDGLGYLYSPAGFFYFTKKGKARQTLPYDNGPDYFSEGMARLERNGKIGFFDKGLSVTIEPRYDYAYPFKNGLSLVCMGCTRRKSGEHTEITGGKWGTIDKEGAVVQSITHLRHELDAGSE